MNALIIIFDAIKTPNFTTNIYAHIYILLMEELSAIPFFLFPLSTKINDDSLPRIYSLFFLFRLFFVSSFFCEYENIQSITHPYLLTRDISSFVRSFFLILFFLFLSLFHIYQTGDKFVGSRLKVSPA